MADAPLHDDDPDEGGDRESAASIADRVANGEAQHPQSDSEAPAPPPMPGEYQLSLDVRGLVPPSARKVSNAVVVISSHEQEVDGLFSPNEAFPFLVIGVPGQHVNVPVRDPKSKETPKRVASYKLRQSVESQSVQRADSPDVVYDLFSLLFENTPEEAGALLERLNALAKTRLQSVA